MKKRMFQFFYRHETFFSIAYVLLPLGIVVSIFVFSQLPSVGPVRKLTEAFSMPIINRYWLLYKSRPHSDLVAMLHRGESEAVIRRVEDELRSLGHVQQQHLLGGLKGMYFRLGAQATMQSGRRPAAARVFFEKWIAFNPLSPEPSKEMGRFLFNMGDEKCLDYFQSAWKMTPYDKDLFELYIAALELAGRKEVIGSIVSEYQRSVVLETIGIDGKGISLCADGSVHRILVSSKAAIENATFNHDDFKLVVKGLFPVYDQWGVPVMVGGLRSAATNGTYVDLQLLKRIPKATMIILKRTGNDRTVQMSGIPID